MRQVAGQSGDDEAMRQRTLALAVPVAVVCLALLAGCVPQQGATEPARTATPSQTPSATATPTPSATPDAAADGTPVTIACDKLISAQAMYDYNPNFSLKSGYTPAAGSLPAQVTAQKGLACAWVNQTSGALIEVAVANLPAAHLTQLKNALVTTSNSVPTYEVEGYFKVNGANGEAQAFFDPYWIVATSPVFFEPGDAQPIVAAAIAGLR